SDAPWLVPYRRYWAARRRWLSLHRRSSEGYDYSRRLQRLPPRDRRGTDDASGSEPGSRHRCVARSSRGRGQSVRYCQGWCDHHRSRTGGLVETEYGRLQVSTSHRVPYGVAHDGHGQSVEERTALVTASIHTANDASASTASRSGGCKEKERKAAASRWRSKEQ